MLLRKWCTKGANEKNKRKHRKTKENIFFSEFSAFSVLKTKFRPVRLKLYVVFCRSAAS